MALESQDQSAVLRAYGQSALDPAAVDNIIAALQAIHNPRSPNETRQQATEFLDRQKVDSTASVNGFALATNSQQPAVVRHFGLSLIEHTIKHHWQEIQGPQHTALREMVQKLSNAITEQDAHYIRSKIAHIWIELAKRSWAAEWLDMDANLIGLWQRQDIHKELVLTVLEALSEDVFYREDSAATLRGTELSSALVEVFTAERQRSSGDEKNIQKSGLRADSDGWLVRISQYLSSYDESSVHGRGAKANMIHALATLRSVFSWVMMTAIISSNSFESICRLLASQDDPAILLAAIEALHALYTRTHLSQREFKALVLPLYEPANVGLLKRLFDWSTVDPQDIDEAMYSLTKKFSEVISFLCDHIEEHADLLLQELDLSVFFQFSIGILRHPSLFVSIPILHSWTRLLASPTIGDSAPVWSVMELLLETACQRIIKYEALPENSEEPAIVFLNEDISTIPERHAFLGNYRRFCHSIVELIAQRRPREALEYLVPQADEEINRFGQQDATFDPSTFQRDSLVLLQVDAHLTVVEAAVRGFSKWVLIQGKSPEEDEEQRVSIERKLDEWASEVLSRTFGNPLMKQRVIKLAIELSTRGLEQNEGFALRVLEHILVSQPSDRPEHPTYSDSVKELHVFATSELRKLGIRYADYFSTFYDQLEAKVQDILRTTTLEEKPQSELTGLLFIIAQRSNNLDMDFRWQKLTSFVDPIQESWQRPELSHALSSFENFCKLLGIDKVGSYMQERNAHRIEDWSTTPLDQSGLDLQATMSSLFQQALPLRSSKTILAVSTENLRIDSRPYQIACELWHARIPSILPNVLALVKHTHSFHDAATWSAYPIELQQILRRILTDRFWQAGISSGTKDQFYAKITSTKTTLEGFASSVRGKLRTIRESCYSILFCMSRLGDYFYGYEELSAPLADAIFGTAGNLSAHQFSVLLNMARYLIDDCPVERRDSFLPPVLSTLFVQLDNTITREWQKVVEKRSTSAVEDNLTEEMKDESILRQFTYSAIMLVTNILDPNRETDDKARTVTHHSSNHHQHRRKSSINNVDQSGTKSPKLLRTYVLANTTILEPMLLFCTHALQVRDTRSASIITRVIRSIVPVFSQPEINTGVPIEVAPIIREFISSEVLRAAITSLHDPYFVDLQKDLAQLIASIWTCYGLPYEMDGQPLTQTPQAIILSLPSMSVDRVERAARHLAETESARQQRAIVLQLLEGLRGVSIHEMGKINSTRNGGQSLVQKRYVGNNGPQGGMEGVDQVHPVNVDDGPDLTGVAEIFG